MTPAEPKIIGRPPVVAEQPKKSVFGLDADLLKSLTLEDLIEDTKPQADQAASNYKTEQAETPATDMMNMTIDDLRQMHGIQPDPESSVNKLKMRCSFYNDKYADGEAA